jgi:predicted SAM-dependent methyltransferase
MLYDTYPHLGRLASERPARRRLSQQFPLHLWYALRDEYRLVPVHLGAGKVRRALHGRSSLKVNIAPGSHPFPGWINIDVTNGPGIDYRYDCRKNLPFDTGSVADFYTEHFVEHLEYSLEAQTFFQECARVIAPGRHLRVVVPDAGLFLRAYAGDDRDALSRLTVEEPWFTGKWHTPMELINVVFRQGHEHHFAYDEETLCQLFEHYGFAASARGFNDSDIPGFASDTPSRRAYSLYVEGVRRAPGP